MSKHKFNPGDKVRFRADTCVKDRSFIGQDGKFRVIEFGEVMEVTRMPDEYTSESCWADFLFVMWSGIEIIVYKPCLEPVNDIKKCKCDIGILTSAGCKCGGA